MMLRNGTSIKNCRLWKWDEAVLKQELLQRHL